MLVKGVLQRLADLGATGVRELDGKPEDVVFALPKECGSCLSIDPAAARPKLRGPCSPRGLHPAGIESVGRAAHSYA